MKKSLLTALCLALCAALSIGGTLAYLSDSEEAVNVMTVGKVDIVLNEYQRGEDKDGDGNADELVPFENPQNLMPIVGSAQGNKDNWGLPTDKNYVDKLTTIKNVDRSDAWVRFIVAVPANIGPLDEAAAATGNVSKSVVHHNFANRFDMDGDSAFKTGKWDVEGNPYYDEWMLGGEFYKEYNVPTSYGIVDAGTIEIDGIVYSVEIYTRSTPLAYNEETTAALGGFYVDANVDYNDETDTWEYVEFKNGERVVTTINYDLDNGVIIPVMAQAVQADGFENPVEAFKSAFGDTIEDGKLTIINPWKTLKVGVEQSAGTAEELDKALLTNGTITVEKAISTDSLEIPATADVTVDLSENKVSTETGLVNNGKAVIENGTVETSYPGAITDIVYGARTPVGAETTYNNVDVVSNNGGVNVWGNAVWNDGDVTLNSMSTSTRHLFYVAGTEEGEGKLTINGGEFKFNPTNRTRKGYYIMADGEYAEVIVNDGIFHEPSTRSGYTAGIAENGGEVLIRGGQFKFDPSNWVDTGYQAVKNAEGWWIVSAVNP